jgi:ubiquinone/menaquinone biosynthesis C-methylase UbiE
MRPTLADFGSAIDNRLERNKPRARIAARSANNGTAVHKEIVALSPGAIMLGMQGAFIQDLTEDALRRAGIKRGMSVLDLGCGVGDVSLTVGRLVGPTGTVLGIDRSSEAIATAQRRVVEAGQCYWVRFAMAEIDAFSPDQVFDAIIGRPILTYLPDPAAMLRRLATHLRPGGIMAFQELAMPAAKNCS